MEAFMHKCLAAVTGTLAVATVALLASHPAQAGASASAASKYGHSSQAATTQHVRSNRLARNPDVAITEYSSSSAKNPPRGHGYR
jgi:hypothetical protein